ncbi:MAG: hypothetical protein EHM36_14620 [Deltaproteobacteria bacterium]|nr:MAG: hypothetical protein EHM36_14620 [Deltaproteobacteria bacterium]
MRSILICTVGTSLKTNLEKEPVCGEFLRQGNSKGLILHMGSLDPGDRLLGAEINSVASIVQKGMLSSLERLFLLVSDTREGQLIGGILQDYFSRPKNSLRFDSVEVSRIPTGESRNIFLRRAIILTLFFSRT